VDNREVLHHRYARALFEVAEDKGKAEDIMMHLRLINDFLRAGKQASKFLYSPVIEDEKKMKLLLSIAKQGDFCTEFMNFLKMLLEKKRLNLLHGILLRYRDFFDVYKKRVYVLIKSACEMEKPQMKRLKEMLKKRLGKEIAVKHEIEPSLMGGLLIKVGDRVYDASLRRNLAKLREVMTS